MIHSAPKLDVSIIIPVFNEEANIQNCYDELSRSVGSIPLSCELLFIDDGSSDRSFSILKEIALRDKKVRVIRFRKNFGQSAAMSAGIDHAQGEWIVTIDADLQNDPADIPRLLDMARTEDIDIVSGWREKRKDSFVSRVLVSRVANFLIAKLTKVHLHDYGCTLKVYRRDVIKDVSLYGELHRFLPALCSWHGATVREVPVNHRPRVAGISKYGLKRIYKVLFDLLSVKFFLSFNSKPLHFFGMTGLLVATPGFLIAGWISFQRFIWGVDIAPRIPSLIFSALAILAGFQMIMIGLLADVIVRTSRETARGTNQHYIIRETVGDPEKS